jgi:hypothetical protein
MKKTPCFLRELGGGRGHAKDAVKGFAFADRRCHEAFLVRLGKYRELRSVKRPVVAAGTVLVGELHSRHTTDLEVLRGNVRRIYPLQLAPRLARLDDRDTGGSHVSSACNVA